MSDGRERFRPGLCLEYRPGAVHARLASDVAVVHRFYDTTARADLVPVKHDRLAGCNCTLRLFEMIDMPAGRGILQGASLV
jgi:hypothetical protein